MTETIPQQAPTEAQAARARQCPLCWAPGGTPCQRKPEGDHLARYLDAYTAGQLSRAYLAMVLAELVVIADVAIIPGAAAPAGVTPVGNLVRYLTDLSLHWAARSRGRCPPGRRCTCTSTASPPRTSPRSFSGTVAGVSARASTVGVASEVALCDGWVTGGAGVGVGDGQGLCVVHDH